MRDLTILCATRGEPVVEPFLVEFQRLAQRLGAMLVLVADGWEARDRLADLVPVGDLPVTIELATHGVHQHMGQRIPQMQSQYVLFVDDDERVTTGLEGWLADGFHHFQPTWLLPRAWLWQSDRIYIKSLPHWPDYQHRLGRPSAITVPTEIHGGWIARGNKPGIAPHRCALEHHKLLIRSRDEREATVSTYDAVKAGAGFPRFYLPEDRPITVGAWEAT